MDIKVKILVIGAGPAGLSVLKALKMLPSEKYEIVCI
jgi:cation diffusion facilitator CzcD-associated flavoprotein CzcO